MTKPIKKVFVLMTGVLMLSASLFIHCGGSGKGRKNQRITVKGSNTMVLLARMWAVNYKKKNPKARLEISGSGSGIGIDALIKGGTDLANASRPMKPREMAKIKGKGAQVISYVVAKDGITIYVHKNNPVSALTLDELKKIYTGKIRNWKEVGGQDKAIILYGRENSSGTYEYFVDHVLHKKGFSIDTKPLQGTAQVVNAVSQDELGIGYGGAGFATGIKKIAVKKSAKEKGIAPSPENILSGDYPLSRPLFIYTTDKILLKKKQVKPFVKWILSPDGQKLIEKAGYFPVSAAQ
ncbi:MAG: PstS family phosphate ABC transporter substrate-binding protein [Spirochaetota bacterium]|nr:PstS family phosphate ABC transporter substrate-binding protein [Spirochaetota bacterium]